MQLKWEKELDESVSTLLEKLRQYGGGANDIDTLIKLTGLELRAEYLILKNATEDGLIDMSLGHDKKTTLYALSYKGREMFRFHDNYIAYKQYQVDLLAKEKLDLRIAKKDLWQKEHWIAIAVITFFIGTALPIIYEHSIGSTPQPIQVILPAPKQPSSSFQHADSIFLFQIH